MNDPRALAFIVYQKIQQELSRQDREEDLSPRRAREIILDALNLLPDVSVRSGPREDLVLVRRISNPDDPDSPAQGTEEVLFNLQEFIDSLGTVWHDFRDQMRDPGKDD